MTYSKFSDIVICHYCKELLRKKEAWKKPIKGFPNSFNYFHVSCYEKPWRAWEKRGIAQY